jgi:hypothetical protein
LRCSLVHAAYMIGQQATATCQTLRLRSEC